MKKLFLAILSPVYASSLLSQQLPPLSMPGEGAYVKGELIYPLENPPTPNAHASTIVETPAGLVSAWFAGTREGNPDVHVRVSRMVNGKWTRPEEVVNGVINDTLRYPAYNPVLFLPQNGPLMMFYKIGPSPSKWWGMVTTSVDNGKTWSKPRKLGEDGKIGHLLGPVKNKPVQLKDGTIISPSSIEYKVPGERDPYWKVHFEVSRDLGKTWQVIGPINDGVEFDAIQPSILTYKDGRMQIICRTRQNVLATSWSSDKGQSWSKLAAMELPNPNSGIDAVTLKDGRQLLIYNHTQGPIGSGRDMLNLAISSDGIKWKPVMTLEMGPAKSEYSYPAIIQSKDGLVHATYTYLRKSVKHVVIDPSKL